MSQEPTGAQSVRRALGLLTAFTEERPELRVSDLARVSGLGPSTVSRLLATLESLGYVEKAEHSGLYRLGHNVLALAGVVLNQSPVRREARQIAENLACTLGLGVNVAERHDDQLSYLLSYAGKLAPRSFTMVGRRGPLYASALGKSLISEMSAGEVRALLAELRPFTPRTITEHEILDAVLAEVRERGYATEVEELAFGRGCVAAPIRDRTNRIVAALSISGPLSALDLSRREGELVGAVVEAASEISGNLGYVASAATFGSVR